MKNNKQNDNKPNEQEECCTSGEEKKQSRPKGFYIEAGQNKNTGNAGGPTGRPNKNKGNDLAVSRFVSEGNPNTQKDRTEAPAAKGSPNAADDV